MFKDFVNRILPPIIYRSVFDLHLSVSHTALKSLVGVVDTDIEGETVTQPEEREREEVEGSDGGRREDTSLLRTNLYRKSPGPGLRSCDETK